MERKGLKTARKRLNLTQETIADILGVSPAQISRWESGKDGIPSQRLPALVRAYQGSVDELLGGEEGEAAPVVMIEMLPTTVGAGGGGLGVGEYSSVAFSRRLIEEDLRVDAEDLLAVVIEGDSMAPDYLSGDQLLIHRRKTGISQPGTFCLWDGDGYVIKDLEKIYDSEPAKVRVMSRNTRYREVERLADEVQIMGRVIWFARRV